MRKTLIAATCIASLTSLTACGSSKTTTATAASTTVAPATTKAPAASTTVSAATTKAPAATSAASATTAKAAATTAATKPAAAAGVDVVLKEWSIEAPASVKAGEVTFNVKNGGSFPHELAVVKGDSYETLPLAASGAVDEGKLAGGALLGRTGKIAGAGTEAKAFKLEPGNYVLVCNLGAGPNSHAKAGQRLSITVTA
jgi:hypothetical protein